MLFADNLKSKTGKVPYSLLIHEVKILGEDLKVSKHSKSTGLLLVVNAEEFVVSVNKSCSVQLS